VRCGHTGLALRIHQHDRPLARFLSRDLTCRVGLQRSTILGAAGARPVDLLLLAGLLQAFVRGQGRLGIFIRGVRPLPCGQRLAHLRAQPILVPCFPRPGAFCIPVGRGQIGLALRPQLRRFLPPVAQVTDAARTSPRAI
jgi:hypothetical protein